MSVGLMASWASCAFFTFLEYFGGLCATKFCPYLHPVNLNPHKINQNLLKPQKKHSKLNKNNNATSDEIVMGERNNKFLKHR